MAKKITVTTTETCTYQFTFTVDGFTDDTSLQKLAEDHFTGEGPDPNWFVAVDERTHDITKIEETDEA